MQLFEDQAFRLCSMAFEHILEDDHVASDRIVYAVVPKLIPASSVMYGKIFLSPTITTGNDEQVTGIVFRSFPDTLHCEVQSHYTTEIFYIIADRNSNKSVFLLKHLNGMLFTLKSHLQDISFLNEDIMLHKRLFGYQMKRSDDGSFLMI